MAEKWYGHGRTGRTADYSIAQPSVASFCVNPRQCNDARSWWANNAVNYPATATLASQYFSVSATSAQSERQFSTSLLADKTNKDVGLSQAAR